MGGRGGGAMVGKGSRKHPSQIKAAHLGQHDKVERMREKKARREARRREREREQSRPLA